MTNYHSKYWAHALTLKNASNTIDNLSRSIANARVDLNPHQVHAALFALKSPVSRGSILADEVGLGKTIEAGLVMAQRWAERRRRILLIVPAFLRKQWELELADKFFLPATVVDSKTFNEAAREGNDPFIIADRIVICSYQFAAEKQTFLSQIPWDLVVIDEAHRMRNVYKSSNKQAKAIAEALKNAPKLLLTATPLQNNLMELYGLISVIDPYVFGDEASFRQLFVQSKDEDSRNRELKDRISPLITRTLRKQVREYISFTQRVAITQNFTPTDDEQKLYEGLSAYLQKDTLCALPNSQRELITLILRKLLASSSYAIAHTLASLIKRLEQQAGPQAILDDQEIELLETLSQEWKEEIVPPPLDEKAKAEQAKIREEIQELKSYLSLAEKIKNNTKGEALIIALNRAFLSAEQLGAARKAVIFTESKRTQKYLYDLLSNSGYQDQIVLINGSNTDPSSKAIYEAWVEKQGQAKSNCSRAVDMKAALVQHFRDHGTILLATEAAAEGINLQFCSLVVNYDLPWNPQRIEQRIGRCHRYGQKHDVVVVNFLNTRNEADKRVFELLNDKFKLFNGVFGASDEVLGAIESGVDIEKRICQVYQTCRTSDQIKEAFDTLQRELDEQIQAKLQQARESIFDHFDEEVSSRLKMQKTETESSLDQRTRWLLNIASHELGIPMTGVRSFTHEGITYFMDWRTAEKENGSFFREDDSLGQHLISKARDRTLPCSALEFDYSSYPHKISLLESLIGSSGWLELSKLHVETFEPEEYLLFTAQTAGGETIDPEAAEKLFHLMAIDRGEVFEAVPALDSLRESAQLKCIKQVESRASAIYDEEVAKLEAWSEDLKLGLERELKDLEKDIKDARKCAALSRTLAEKLEHQKKIKVLEAQRNAKRKALFSEQDRIEAQRDDLITRVEKRLQPKASIEPIFTIRWSLK